MIISIPLNELSCLPKHILGPSPKGINAKGCLFALFSGKNLSGSYWSGLGKYSGSFCIDLNGIITDVPASNVTSVPGILYLFLHTLEIYITGAYLRRDSVKIIALRIILNNWTGN